MKESILVGLGGMQTVVFSAIETMTKREYRMADTLDEAKKLIEKLP